jgi:hypothetical protein
MVEKLESIKVAGTSQAGSSLLPSVISQPSPDIKLYCSYPNFTNYKYN